MKKSKNKTKKNKKKYGIALSEDLANFLEIIVKSNNLSYSEAIRYIFSIVFDIVNKKLGPESYKLNNIHRALLEEEEYIHKKITEQFTPKSKIDYIINVLLKKHSSQIAEKNKFQRLYITFEKLGHSIVFTYNLRTKEYMLIETPKFGVVNVDFIRDYGIPIYEIRSDYCFLTPYITYLFFKHKHISVGRKTLFDLIVPKEATIFLKFEKDKTIYIRGNEVKCIDVKLGRGAFREIMSMCALAMCCDTEIIARKIKDAHFVSLEKDNIEKYLVK